jgi:tol-pal system protein YbgF
MRRRALALAAAALGAVLVAAPVAAQTPIDESISKRDAKRLDEMEKVVKEMRAIVFKGRDSGQPVVVQPADTDARLADFSTRLNDLEQSLTRINGALESTAHELDQAKRDNAALRDQLKSLGDRLAGLEQRQAEAAPPPQAAAPPAQAAQGQSAPAADPAEAFAAARQLMLSGDYDSAEEAFRTYVQTYPDAPRAPEARYWWGKTLAVKGAHAEAATAYLGAIRNWPQTSWAPDATVELARELAATKRIEPACQILAELPKRYPKAPATVKSRSAAVAAQAKCGG